MEQHVAGQVAVDELAGGGHRAQRGGQPRQVADLREVAGGNLTPGDAVADRPWAGPLVQERRPRDPAQGGMQTLAYSQDLRPAALLMPAGQVLGSAPVIDA